MTNSVNMLVEELLDEKAYSGQHMKYMDRFKFGFTFMHMINRLTTASLTGSTLENTRKALVKTVAGCDSAEDISFLRRDASQGISTLTKIAERHPDPERRKEVAVHLAWMRKEYRDMLNSRSNEIKEKK